MERLTITTASGVVTWSCWPEGIVTTSYETIGLLTWRREDREGYRVEFCGLDDARAFAGVS